MKRGWKRLLKKDFDFDFFYLLKLERYKIKQMSKFFKTRAIVASADRTAQELDLCYNLLTIVMYEKPGIVNTRNASRFLNEYSVEMLKNPDNKIKGYMYTDLRVKKAWNLYCKIRLERTFYWWD